MVSILSRPQWVNTDPTGNSHTGTIKLSPFDGQLINGYANLNYEQHAINQLTPERGVSIMNM